MTSEVSREFVCRSFVCCAPPWQGNGQDLESPAVFGEHLQLISSLESRGSGSPVTWRFLQTQRKERKERKGRLKACFAALRVPRTLGQLGQPAHCRRQPRASKPATGRSGRKQRRCGAQLGFRQVRCMDSCGTPLLRFLWLLPTGNKTFGFRLGP